MPSEIESIIDEMDLVVASCVVGIPDGLGNDIIHAFVQRKSEELKEEDVLKYVHGLSIKIVMGQDGTIYDGTLFYYFLGRQVSVQFEAIGGGKLLH